MARKRLCNFSQFLRGRTAGSHANRQFVVVGVMTARYVLGYNRRKKFSTDDVKLKRGTRLDPSATHRWVTEFLSSWEVGHDVSHSRLADEMLAACPQLHDKVRQHWEGY